MIVSDAALIAAVEIRIVRNACLLASAYECVTDGKCPSWHLHADRAIHAMKVIIEALVAFGTFEVGEDIAIAPSFTACLLYTSDAADE